MLPDGLKVFASVSMLDGNVLVRKRHMIFVKGTQSEKAVAQKGEQLDVLGIPRINLALVAWRAANARSWPEVLDWNLPFEFIVVGVYED